MSASIVSIEQMLAILANQEKETNEQKILNDSKEGQTFLPNVLDESYNTPGCQGINGAKCPNSDCRNVEIRFMVKHYIPMSTMRVINEYAGSGYDLQCLACKTVFHFCGSKGMFGTYKLDNCVFVPRSWAIEKLGIE